MSLRPGKPSNWWPRCCALYWLGWSATVALSDDGQLLVSTDQAPTAPETELNFVVRRIVRPPKILGEGTALDLSADKKSVLALVKEELVLLSVGPGTPRKLPTPGLEVQDGRLFRDGKRLVVAAGPPKGREHQVYQLEVGSDAETPLWVRATALFTLPSPLRSPRTSAGLRPGTARTCLWCFPSPAGRPFGFRNSRPTEMCFPWGGRREVTSGYSRGFNPPAQLIRVNLGSHQIKESRELAPAEPNWGHLPGFGRHTPDGSAPRSPPTISTASGADCSSCVARARGGTDASDCGGTASLWHPGPAGSAALG